MCRPCYLNLAHKLALRSSRWIVSILPVMIHHAESLTTGLWLAALLGLLKLVLFHPLCHVHPGLLCIISVFEIPNDTSWLPASIILKEGTFIFKVDADGVIGLDRKCSVLQSDQ